jgi:hypothetical protein
MAETDLQQRDLSHLTIEQMNAAERAEMKRRYDAFVRAVGKAKRSAEPAGHDHGKPQRWTPPRAVR